jgi:hypothetical protein
VSLISAVDVPTEIREASIFTSSSGVGVGVGVGSGSGSGTGLGSTQATIAIVANTIAKRERMKLNFFIRNVK